MPLTWYMYCSCWLAANAGVIAGATVGALVGLILIILVIVFMCTRRKKDTEEDLANDIK